MSEAGRIRRRFGERAHRALTNLNERVRRRFARAGWFRLSDAPARIIPTRISLLPGRPIGVIGRAIARDRYTHRDRDFSFGALLRYARTCSVLLGCAGCHAIELRLRLNAAIIEGGCRPRLKLNPRLVTFDVLLTVEGPCRRPARAQGRQGSSRRQSTGPLIHLLWCRRRLDDEGIDQPDTKD